MLKKFIANLPTLPSFIVGALLFFVIAGFFFSVVSYGNNFPSMEKDTEKAEKKFSEARDLYDKGEKEKAFDLLEEAAELGCSDAQYQLASHYEKLLTEKNDEKKQKDWDSKGAYWLVLAALNGHSKAQLSLGQDFLDVTQYDWWGLFKKKYWKKESPPTCADWLLMAAENGEVEAQYALGVSYLQASREATDSDDVDRFRENALALLRTAVENESLDAAYLLGYLYDAEGLGKPEEAIELYKKAGEYEQMAAYRLGVCYEEGRCGVEVDEEESLKWFEKAEKLWLVSMQEDHDLLFSSDATETKPDDKNVDNAVSEDFIESESNEQLESFFDEQLGEKRKVDFEGVKGKAEKGDAAAQYELGYYYETGLGVERNWNEAFKWYKKSAEQEYGDGLAALGVCYRYGIGTKIDMKKAVEFLQKGVGQDNVKAIGAMAYLLAVDGFSQKKGLFLEGEMLDPAEFQEFVQQHLVKCADSDCIDVASTMGLAYQLGLGVEQNEAKSEQYISKYTELLNTEIADRRAVALFKCAVACLLSPEIEIQKLGYAFLTTAKAQGLVDAQVNLGVYCISGLEDIANPEERTGFQLLESAAKQNHHKANFLLGVLYSCGNVVSQNIDKAVEYFKKSEELGYCRAYYMLAVCYSNLKNNSERERYLEKALEIGDSNAKFYKGLDYLKVDNYDGLQFIYEAIDSGNMDANEFICERLRIEGEEPIENRDQKFISSFESHIKALRNEGQSELADAYQDQMDQYLNSDPVDYQPNYEALHNQMLQEKNEELINELQQRNDDLFERRFDGMDFSFPELL